jgi:glycine/D-amino acid oxidase-like deaminating enzyme
MSSGADVIIIGAGIVGAACADALAREGLGVTVLDAATTCAGATVAGMGHIVVMDDSEAQFALTRYSSRLWDELAPQMPREAEYERRGTLWVAANDAEMTAVHAKAVYYRERGVAADILNEQEVREAEANLRDGIVGALLVPGDAVVCAPVAAEWLLHRARQRGASVRYDCRVLNVDSNGVRLADGATLSAEYIICATGASASVLFPGLGVRPRKGHLAITDRYPGFLRHQIVELGYLASAHGHDLESVAFNVQPRATGQVLIGSSRQYGVEGSEIDAPVLSRMLSRAFEYMPRLKNLSVIRVWTGFRAATEDKLPLLGAVRGSSTLYLAVGHEGLGITTSTGSAALITDMLMGREPSIDPAPYLASRITEPAHA